MNFFLKCISATLSACMLLSPLTPALGSEVLPISMEERQVEALYASYTGVVTDIQDHYAIEGGKILAMNSEAMGEATFVITPDVLVLGIDEFQVGDELIGFYETNRPMVLIYPPQYPLSVVVAASEDSFVKVDRFDADLLSYDGSLKLNLGENSTAEIVDQRGEAFEGDLTDRVLVVFYTITTRSIPAQTPPTKIVVLDERIPELPEDVELPDEEPPVDTGPIVLPNEPADPAPTPETQPVLPPAEIEPIDPEAIASYPIIVEQQAIDTSAPFLNDQGSVMVPVRPIAQALGYEVVWNGEESTVHLGEEISFRIGEEIAELESSALLQEGITYVPLQFFTKVVGMNNAYLFEGQIVIDNSEKME